MTDLQHILNDIARCKERIAQIESGERGQIPDGARHTNPGRAFENQLRGQRQALERFETEYVNAKLGNGWSASEIIVRMERPVGPISPELPVMSLKIGDVTRGRLQTLLEETPGNFIQRSRLQELLK